MRILGKQAIQWNVDRITCISRVKFKAMWTRQTMYVQRDLRRVRATIVAVERQEILHIVSVCL